MRVALLFCATVLLFVQAREEEGEPKSNEEINNALLALREREAVLGDSIEAYSAKLSRLGEEAQNLALSRDSGSKRNPSPLLIEALEMDLSTASFAAKTCQQEIQFELESIQEDAQRLDNRVSAGTTEQDLLQAKSALRETEDLIEKKNQLAQSLEMEMQRAKSELSEMEIQISVSPLDKLPEILLRQQIGELEIVAETNQSQIDNLQKERTDLVRSASQLDQEQQKRQIESEEIDGAIKHSQSTLANLKERAQQQKEEQLELELEAERLSKLQSLAVQEIQAHTGKIDGLDSNPMLENHIRLAEAAKAGLENFQLKFQMADGKMAKELENDSGKLEQLYLWACKASSKELSEVVQRKLQALKEEAVRSRNSLDKESQTRANLAENRTVAKSSICSMKETIAFFQKEAQSSLESQGQEDMEYLKRCLEKVNETDGHMRSIQQESSLMDQAIPRIEKGMIRLQSQIIVIDGVIELIQKFQQSWISQGSGKTAKLIGPSLFSPNYVREFMSQLTRYEKNAQMAESWRGDGRIREARLQQIFNSRKSKVEAVRLQLQNQINLDLEQTKNRLEELSKQHGIVVQQLSKIDPEALAKQAETLQGQIQHMLELQSQVNAEILQSSGRLVELSDSIKSNESQLHKLQLDQDGIVDEMNGKRLELEHCVTEQAEQQTEAANRVTSLESLHYRLEGQRRELLDEILVLTERSTRENSRVSEIQRTALDEDEQIKQARAIIQKRKMELEEKQNRVLPALVRKKDEAERLLRSSQQQAEQQNEHPNPKEHDERVRSVKEKISVCKTELENAKGEHEEVQRKIAKLLETLSSQGGRDYLEIAQEKQWCEGLDAQSLSVKDLSSSSFTLECIQLWLDSPSSTITQFGLNPHYLDILDAMHTDILSSLSSDVFSALFHSVENLDGFIALKRMLDCGEGFFAFLEDFPSKIDSSAFQNSDFTSQLLSHVKQCPSLLEQAHLFLDEQNMAAIEEHCGHLGPLNQLSVHQLSLLTAKCIAKLDNRSLKGMQAEAIQTISPAAFVSFDRDKLVAAGDAALSVHAHQIYGLGEPQKHTVDTHACRYFVDNLERLSSRDSQAAILSRCGTLYNLNTDNRGAPLLSSAWRLCSLFLFVLICAFK